MTPKTYFDEIVRPTYDDYLKEPLSVRRAMLACIVCYHIADAVYSHRGSPKKMSPRKIVEIEIVPQCGDFRQIDAVAHAMKHIELDDRHDGGEMSQLNISEVIIGSGAAFSDGSYFSDGSTFSDMPDVPVVDRGSGKKWDVAHSLKLVVEFLSSYSATVS